MSEYNVYLVPADEPADRKRGVKRKVIGYLERLGIVDGFADKALGWYASGPKSQDLFVDSDDDQPSFEYMYVYERKEAHFVPDSHTGEFAAKCSHCNADIDQAIYDMLNEQGEDDNAQDMIGHAIACPSCERANPIAALNAEIETAVTRFFINGSSWILVAASNRHEIESSAAERDACPVAFEGTEAPRVGMIYPIRRLNA